MPFQLKQAFDCVTVLFVDIANFEVISAGNPLDAVRCVNIVFSCLDNVIDRHSVYKVISFLYKHVIS